MIAWRKVQSWCFIHAAKKVSPPLFNDHMLQEWDGGERAEWVSERVWRRRCYLRTLKEEERRERKLRESATSPRVFEPTTCNEPPCSLSHCTLYAAAAATVAAIMACNQNVIKKEREKERRRAGPKVNEFSLTHTHSSLPLAQSLLPLHLPSLANDRAFASAFLLPRLWLFSCRWCVWWLAHTFFPSVF